MRKVEQRRLSTRLIYPLLLAGIVAASCTAQAEDNQRMLSSNPQPPDVRLGPLYHAVQAAKLYPDQKTFADAVPHGDPTAILADWQMQKTQGNFDLKRFVNTNFTLPAEGEK